LETRISSPSRVDIDALMIRKYSGWAVWVENGPMRAVDRARWIAIGPFSAIITISRRPKRRAAMAATATKTMDRVRWLGSRSCAEGNGAPGAA
jgi:hypothetical protein